MTLELDHIFVAASVGAPEIRLLKAAGFTEGDTNEHQGQGTACRRVYFENAYLELLWLVDAQAADTPPVRRTGLAQRADPRHSSSPFGFGLRSSVEPVPDPPFDTWKYSPSYLPAGAAFAMAANSDMLDEPLIFVLPWSRTPTWSTPDHPNGARRLTRTHLVFHRGARSWVMQQFESLGLVSLSTGDGPLLQIEFDHAAQRERRDLRPELPIEVAW